MKYLSILFLASMFLYSCGDNSSKLEASNDLEFFIDTVMIDTGDDIINLKFGIYFSGLSNDKKYLFNSGGVSPYLERINLETLKFEEKMEFDDDGPDAFGAYVSVVSSDLNNNLILTSWDGTSVFDMDKKKLKKYMLDGSHFEGDNLMGREQFVAKLIPTKDYKKVYGLIQNYDSGEIFFSIVDDDSKKLKKIKLEGYERASAFTVTHRVGNGASIAPQSTEINRYGDKIVVSNPVFSKVAVYDLESETLEYKECTPILTAKEKTGQYKNEVSSNEELQNEKLRISEEVTFLPLMDDLNNNRYLRISKIAKLKTNDKDQFENDDHQIFVSILNNSFEVIQEGEVGSVIGKLFSTSIPQKPFFKDGMIWLYLNVDDELAFVRLGLN